MTKGFEDNNPLNKLSGKTVAQKEATTAIESASQPPAEPAQEKPQAKKRKVGRPKTKDVRNSCRNINVAVPNELLDKWEEVKIVYGGNLTGYVTKLIEKDMDANYEQYKNILNSLKNI